MCVCVYIPRYSWRLKGEVQLAHPYQPGHTNSIQFHFASHVQASHASTTAKLKIAARGLRQCQLANLSAEVTSSTPTSLPLQHPLGYNMHAYWCIRSFLWFICDMIPPEYRESPWYHFLRVPTTKNCTQWSCLPFTVWCMTHLFFWKYQT